MPGSIPSQRFRCEVSYLSCPQEACILEREGEEEEERERECQAIEIGENKICKPRGIQWRKQTENSDRKERDLLGEDKEVSLKEGTKGEVK